MFSCLLASATLSGCAAYTKPIAFEEKPASGESYLYGRFTIEAPKAFLGFDGYQTMGYSFTCRDGTQFIVRFSIEQPVQLIRVTPTSCSLMEIVYTNGDGQIRGRKPSPIGVLKDVSFQAGVANYLGDYFASSKTTSYGSTLRTSWGVDAVRNNYAATTFDMKTKYHAFANIVTQDKIGPAR
ncbi:MAG: hypothetical protein V4650_01640 [Pseudomonadota bacterium]